LVVAEVGYRSHRTLLPLLRSFPNTFLSIGSNFTAHRAVEWYARHLGAERLLFGTGLPEAEPGAAIGQLLFADIPEGDRRAIGAENARRLSHGVRRS
ncbi:MAG: amidohydrolase family protein, partial [Lentisphaeria bacterium]|nr:amidohydrolase family protein [Lentisphaeria bacterium]